MSITSHTGAVRSSSLETEGPPLESMVNKNVNWLGSNFLFFYMFVVISGSLLVSTVLVQGHILTPKQGWTTLHVIHGIINFLVMHYITGSPGELGAQGEYDDLSWWDQLDDGLEWTTSKKVLMVITIALFSLTCHCTDYDLHHLGINSLVFALTLGPKIPLFRRKPIKRY